MLLNRHKSKKPNVPMISISLLTLKLFALLYRPSIGLAAARIDARAFKVAYFFFHKYENGIL
jgi:hypothetical protein